MDIKRELEFEVMMLDEQNEKVGEREQKRLDNMQHKIDLVKMKQEKIKGQSKFKLMSIRNLTCIWLN